MADLTDSEEKLLVDGLVGVTPYSTPATVYLALLTSNPTHTGSVAGELIGLGYARIDLTSLYSASTDGSSSNTSLVESALATADWTPITHVGFMRGGTQGVADMMVKVTLVEAITVLLGEKFSVPLSQLTVTAE